MKLFSRFLADQTGVTAIEYGLIAGATCLALIAAMPTFGTNLSGTYARIESYFN